MTARRMFTELLQAGTQAKPGYAAAGVAAVAAGGFLAGWTIDGKAEPGMDVHVHLSVPGRSA